MRRELVRRLNQIPNVSVPEGNLGGLPSFPLATLTDGAALRAFLSTLEWFYAEVRAS